MRLLPLALLLLACQAAVEAAPSAADIVTGEVVDAASGEVPTILFEPPRPSSRDTVTARVANPVPGVVYTFSWSLVDGTGGPEGATLEAALTSRGQVWQVTVIPDGDAAFAGSGTISIENAAPVCAAAVIEPAEATGDSPLTCRCDGRDDTDQDPAADTCVWSAGDTVGCTLPAGVATAGQLVTCTLTPSDGLASGPVVFAEVTLGNRAPTGGEVTVSPAQLREGDTATCAPAGATDADGDAVTWSLRWHVNEEPLSDPHGAEPTLGSAWFDEGDVVSCVATPSDGQLAGAQVTSQPASVLNSPPTVQEAQVTPPVLHRGDSASCDAVGVVDPDNGDTPTVQTAWVVNGEVRDSLGVLAVGDAVVCRTAAVDEEGPGEPVDSEVVVVQNWAPTLGAVQISPAQPRTSDTLVCEALLPADADDDALSSTVLWTRNGAVLTAQTEPTLAGVFAAGDLVSCTLTLTDTYGGSVSSNAKPVTVLPSPPTLAGAAITPAAPSPCATLTCSPIGLEDADGLDGVALSTTWRVGGVVVATTPTLLLSGPGEVNCTLVASDGNGSATAAATATVSDTPPTLDGAALVPAQPVAEGIVSCVALNLADPDGCPLAQPKVQWFVDDSLVASGAALDTAGLPAGAELRCELLAGTTKATTSATLAPLPVGAPLVSMQVNGDAVTCAATPQPESPEGLLWRWWVGDEQFLAEQTLPVPGACARVRCQAETGLGVSNVAERVMPYGAACADTNPCTDDTCGPVGGCAHPPASGPCDDGDACTQGDTCEGGACVGPVAGCADGNPCTTDGDCVPGVGCSWTPAPGPCDDGNVCTLGDQCANGSCAPGTAKTCDDGLPCTLDACDAKGGCTATPTSGAACDDGSACSTNDACSAGTCVGVPVTPGLPCTQGNGSPGYCGAGSCGSNAAPSAPTVSVQPNAPIGGDVLTCIASGSVDVDNSPQPISYVYSWRRNGSDLGVSTTTLPATYVTQGAAITCRAVATDGALSSAVGSATVVVGNAPPTVNGVSVQGVGGAPAAGAALTCTATTNDPDGDPLVRTATWWINGVMVSGVTGALPANKATACAKVRCDLSVSDGKLTVTGASPELQLGTGPGCASSACVSASCTSAGGCDAIPKAGACDDGDPCTGPGTCAASQCTADPLPPSACDDGNPCTIDTCVTGAGCNHVPSGGPCDADGSVCTSGDACISGVCVAGSPLNCSDGVACTSDACDPATGCVDALNPSDVGFPIVFINAAGAALAEGAGLEVVTGPQGGQHIELGLRVTLPPAFTWAPVSLRVVVTVASGCCSGTQIASSTLNAVYFAADGSTGSYKNTALITFMSTAAAPWLNKPACVSVSVSARSQNGATFLASSVARHGFQLQDLQ